MFFLLVASIKCWGREYLSSSPFLIISHFKRPSEKVNSSNKIRAARNVCCVETILMFAVLGRWLSWNEGLVYVAAAKAGMKLCLRLTHGMHNVEVWSVSTTIIPTPTGFPNWDQWSLKYAKCYRAEKNIRTFAEKRVLSKICPGLQWILIF